MILIEVVCWFLSGENRAEGERTRAARLDSFTTFCDHGERPDAAGENTSALL